MSSGSLAHFSDELVELAEKASRSVVGVEHGRGSGSGTVLTPDGYVLTNHHVVKGASRVEVSYSDGEIASAEVLGFDEKTDLAVLQALGNLKSPHLPLVDKRRVKVGQIVVAIGNPFRFERSVSLGLVSALDRSLPGGRGQGQVTMLEGLIQTDAAINPGNSGGPLVSVQAEVVGINTAIVPFGQGLGFAVPSYTASWVAGELIRKGRVHRRYLGISASSIDLPARVSRATEKKRAVLIHSIASGSPAERAGLKRGDLLLVADELELWNLDDLQRVLSLGEARVVKLDTYRSGKALVTQVTPDDRAPAA
jgi:S1-C subfamily serine protease